MNAAREGRGLGGIPPSLANALTTAWNEVLYRNNAAGGLQMVARALEQNPLSSVSATNRPYLRLARLYAQAGQPARGRQWLDEWEAEVNAELRVSQDPGLHEARGTIALAEDRYDEAIEEFRAREVAPRFTASGTFELAQAYDRAGNADSAAAIYERFVNMPGPGRRIFADAFQLPVTYHRLGELYEERDRDKAVEYYSRFVELWQNADEELQPQVREVRGRIARLVGERR